MRECKEQLNNSEEERKKQQRKIEEQQKRICENEYLILAVYPNELEWTAGNADADSRYTRNVIIHGGDIKYAIRAVEFLEELGETTRAQNASEGFRITYGLSIGELRPILATAPEELVDLLNKRAVLEKLRKWKGIFHKGTEKWIEACDKATKG